MGGKCCCAKKETTEGTDYDQMKVQKSDKIQRKDTEQGAKKKGNKKAKKNMLTFKNETIEYHQLPVPGKTTMVPIKPLINVKDLAMAHTPGVVEPCMEVQKNPDLLYRLTNKQRTVALVTNGSSVLGLGNIGAKAAKPDVEGKAMLYKRFSGVDCVDLCVDTGDIDQFINVVKYLAPSFGGINLEDMKAPDCFMIEQSLQEQMPIPVFHNDQHGTAVVVLAALMNSLEIKGKSLDQVKIVVNGAGAGGIACMSMIIAAGANREKCYLCDSEGLIFAGRHYNMNPSKEALAHPVENTQKSLAECAKEADVLIGLSVQDAFTVQIMSGLNPDPIVFALSNPNPEIDPEKAKDLRPDCIVATASPEFENQINNVMSFPYIFRAVLDSMSSHVNLDMKLAAAKAIADLAKQPVPESVRLAYPEREFEFGPSYILPTPFDPRLLEKVACSVAQTAQKTGVAKHPIKDYKQYKAYLNSICKADEDPLIIKG